MFRRAYLIEANLVSSDLRSTAPGIRVPSVKNTVGVPVTFMLLPSAKIFSLGEVHAAGASAGNLLFNIQSSHAFALSAAHQIFFDFTAESSDRMLYMKVYTVTLSICCSVWRKRLQ